MAALKIKSARKLLHTPDAVTRLIDTVGGYASITARGSQENAAGAEWYRGFCDRIVTPAMKKDKRLKRALDPLNMFLCPPLPPSWAADLPACPPRSAVTTKGAAPAPVAPMLGGMDSFRAFPGNAAGVKAAFYWLGMLRGRNPNYKVVTVSSNNLAQHY